MHTQSSNSGQDTSAAPDTLLDLEVDMNPLSESNLSAEQVSEILGKERAIQRRAMDLRDRLVLMFDMHRRSPELYPEPTAIPLRQGNAESLEIAKGALIMEKSLKGSDPDVIIYLEELVERIKKEGGLSQVLSPSEKAEKMAKRLINKGALRENDHVEEPLFDALKEILQGTPHSGILDQIKESRLKMQRALMEAREETEKVQEANELEGFNIPGILNITAFLKKITPEDAGTYIFMDLSNFKYVNDTFSEPLIDELLLRPLTQAFAEKLSTMAGSPVLIARRGDAFSIFLKNGTDPTPVVKAIAAIFSAIITEESVNEQLEQHKNLLAARWPLEEERIKIIASIKSNLLTLECKMGVAQKQSGQPVLQATMHADNLMNQTKPYKGTVKFPVISEGREGEVWNALEGLSSAHVRDVEMEKNYVGRR